MPTLRIEYQRFRTTCGHCGEAYPAVRGPVYDDEAGVGLYLAGMHGCGGVGHVVMTIALVSGDDADAFTLRAWRSGREVQMAFLDGEESPWAADVYLGRILSASQSREHEGRGDVFKVADLICDTIPEVVAFLEGSEEI